MTATYATVATFTIDLSREEQSTSTLREFIVPGVRQHPGFVSGNWLLDRDTNQSVAVLTFSSRDAAESLRSNVEGNRENQAANGVELIEIRILEVTASAVAPG
jgi:hypothetical protein